jgi:hypothetical protein
LDYQAIDPNNGMKGRLAGFIVSSFKIVCFFQLKDTFKNILYFTHSIEVMVSGGERLVLTA